MSLRAPAIFLPLLLAASSSCGGPSKGAAAPSGGCSGGKVWHQEEGERFRGCSSVNGDLELGGALESASDFESLTRVRGDLVVGPSYQLNNVSALSKLRVVEGSVRIRNNMRLGGLFLGALTEVGADLEIEGNSGLRSVSLQHLESIGGTLQLGKANRVLDRVDLSGLRSLSGVKLKIDWQKERPEAVLRAPLY